MSYSRRSIRYSVKNGKRIANQQIDTLSLYDFEGSLTECLKMFKTKKQEIETDYLSKASICYAQYIDGTSKKEIKFNRLYIERGCEAYESDAESARLEVWGERDVLPEEETALIAQEAKANEGQEKRERADFERLSKKFSPK